MNGAIGAISAGGHGTNGSLSLREGVDDKRRIYLDARAGNIWIGGHGANGNLLLFRSDAAEVENSEHATVAMNGRTGSILLKARNEAGRLENRIFLDAQEGDIWLGGNGISGNLFLFPHNGDNSLKEQATVRISGRDGDIVLRNADCAEDFDISDSVEVEPGTVVVIDDEGKLRPALMPYDKRVAGVISGAGECRPALVLDKKDSADKRLPVALMGKVYCKVDAQYGSIAVGDLLTTSATLGHAMRAGEPLRAFGAVIGKALRSFKSGQGLIPVLVALQ
ncbi:MAG TPA: hypothetical protein VJP89_18220 [Pyrinomonadaceae bacterium]|nr:hypothetical protein [Pyrinomonadaceae bacterium]